MLPRMIDKARASMAGTLGEYVYGRDSPFDMAVLDYLGVAPDAFLAGVRNSPEDAAVARWLVANARKRSAEEDENFARIFLNDGDDDADRARFAERRAKLPERVQPKVTGWVDLLDVAEGRIS